MKALIEYVRLSSLHRGNKICLYYTAIIAFFRTSVSGFLSCHLIFKSFLMQLKCEWLSLLALRWYSLPVSHAYKMVWQYHSLVDFLLSVTSDSIALPDIYVTITKCFTGLRSSGSNLIINVHCSGESAYQIGEFINNLQFFSIHSDGWFAVRLSRYWMVHYLCLFILIVRLKLP